VTTIEAPPGRAGTVRSVGGAALLGGALVGLAAWGSVPLLVGTAAVQVLLVLGFLALVDAPAALGVFVIGTAAGLAADVVVHVEHGRVGGLAGVVALSFVAGLLLQLVRPHRTRVTESLADTLVVVVLVSCAATLPAAVQHDTGTWVVRAGLAAATVALVLGRLAHGLRTGTASTRGLAGLVAGLVVGPATSLLVAGDRLSTRQGLLTGLAAAAAAAAADHLTALAGDDLAAQPRDPRRLASLRPVTLLLPFALVPPVLLAAVRLVEGT
jgi:hypothetical protein